MAAIENGPEITLPPHCEAIAETTTLKLGEVVVHTVALRCGPNYRPHTESLTFINSEEPTDPNDLYPAISEACSDCVIWSDEFDGLRAD